MPIHFSNAIFYYSKLVLFLTIIVVRLFVSPISRLPLEERIASLDSKDDTIKYNSGFGAKEMTFIPAAVSISAKYFLDFYLMVF